MSISLHITRTNGFGRGKTENFSSSTLSLGTDATCSMHFDPTWDRTVSPRHATISWDGNALWIEDTSAQGTFIDGRKIAGREKLNQSAKLELGKTGPMLKLEWEAIPEPVTQVQPVSAYVQPSHAPVYVERNAATAPVPANSNRHSLWIFGGIAAAVLAALALVFVIRRSGSQDAAFARIAEDHSDAVALVVVTADGVPPQGCATAWAIGDHIYATNSHVTELVKTVLSKRGACYLVINKKPEMKLHVTRAITHPRYGQDEVSFDGHGMAVPGYDVGLIFTEEKAPKTFKVASKGELEKLDSGYRIAYLGFPMEGMAGGGVNVQNPVATMQSGIVTSATDYWLGKAEFSKRLLIQHNMGAAGGASGSPIFNDDGEVVGILSAGNIVGSITANEKGEAEVTRAPSGVMVNFAQRVDILKDILDNYPR